MPRNQHVLADIWPQAEVAYSNVTARPIACCEDLSRAQGGNWSRPADRAEWPWMTARRRLKRIERYHRERFDYDKFPTQSREVTAQGAPNVRRRAGLAPVATPADLLVRRGFDSAGDGKHLARLIFEITKFMASQAMSKRPERRSLPPKHRGDLARLRNVREFDKNGHASIHL